MTTALDRKSGDYNQFWHDRNYLINSDQVRADVLIVHGLQDWNVTPEQAYNFGRLCQKVMPSMPFYIVGLIFI